MKSSIVLAALALCLVPAAPAPAQCADGLKKGSSFEFTTASADGSALVKGTVTVTKNDGSYVEFLVTSGKQKVTMPGAIDGASLMLTNPKNGTVWSAKCTEQGLDGVATRAGKNTKLSVFRKKELPPGSSRAPAPGLRVRRHSNRNGHDGSGTCAGPGQDSA